MKIKMSVGDRAITTPINDDDWRELTYFQARDYYGENTQRPLKDAIKIALQEEKKRAALDRLVAALRIGVMQLAICEKLDGPNRAATNWPSWWRRLLRPPTMEQYGARRSSVLQAERDAYFKH